jgi:CRISPR-associated protein Csb2
MAYADARLIEQAELEGLQGVRWHPRVGAQRNDGMLRVPGADPEHSEDSLTDLKRAHLSATSRIEHGKPLRTVEKPRVFGRVFYASSERPLGWPYELFALRDESGDSLAYPLAKISHVAAWLRCAAIKAMRPDMNGYPPPDLDEPEKWVVATVAGHRNPTAEGHGQFSYVPLPSIGQEHADAMIRRVMIVAPFHEETHLRHLGEQMDGMPLTAESNSDVVTPPILHRMTLDNVSRCYLATADTWASVTPVILPGHNDHKPAKTVKLIQRALQQSGIEAACEFTWQAVPFFNNTLSAHKYDRHGRHVGYHRPAHLKDLAAIHLQIRFGHGTDVSKSHWIPCNAQGPLIVGSGRHCGLGLFAPASLNRSDE